MSDDLSLFVAGEYQSGHWMTPDEDAVLPMSGELVVMGMDTGLPGPVIRRAVFERVRALMSGMSGFPELISEQVTPEWHECVESLLPVRDKCPGRRCLELSDLIL